jgi:hypothetical protein
LEERVRMTPVDAPEDISYWTTNVW